MSALTGATGPVTVRVTVLLIALLCSGPAEAQQVVSFPTADEGVVFADEYGTGAHAVVLAHGGRFSKASWEDQATELADVGFRVLAIDFRGRGRSRAGPGAAPGDDREHLVVMAAVRYLRDTGAQRISVVGASFGGWAAARATTRLPEGTITRLVLLAHSPIENPEELRADKLFIVARRDARGDGVLRLPELRDQFERSPDPKRLVVLEGSAHAQHIFDGPEGQRLMDEIVAFLRLSEITE